MLSGDAQFFVHYRRVSRFTLRQYLLAWFRNQHQVKAAINDLADDLPEEFYIPLSTAYTWLSLIREKFRLLFAELGLDPNRLACLTDLKNVAEDVALRIFEMPDAWREGGSSIARAPP